MFKLVDSNLGDYYDGETLVVVHLVDVFRDGVEFYVVASFSNLELAGEWVDNFYQWDSYKHLEAFHDIGVVDGQNYLTLNYQNDYIIADNFLAFQDKLLAHDLYRLSWNCYGDNVVVFSSFPFDSYMDNKLVLEPKKVKHRERGIGSKSLKNKLV